MSVGPSVKKWTPWRIVGALTATTLLWFGASMFHFGVKAQRDFEAWQVAKPLDATVDLSRPSEFNTPFHQTCSRAHGQSILLEAMGVSENVPAKELLNGLQARMDILGTEGTNVIESCDFKLFEHDSEAFGKGRHRIFSMVPFRKGEYIARIVVTEGATNLHGKQYRLVGRYDLCGLEALPATIGKVVGSVSLALSIILGVMVGYRIRRDAKRQAKPEAA